MNPWVNPTLFLIDFDPGGDLNTTVMVVLKL
jgi:hypothetical protein